LPGIKVLGGAEIFQVLVVSPHNERMFLPLQPVPLLLQRHLHREKLKILHIVIPLCGIETVGKEYVGM
jgi:hypothetical protein